MQSEGLIVNNEISVIGKIITGFTFSHAVYGEGFYTVYIEVSRLSEACDVLPVTISERLKEKDSIPIGTLVHITGQVRSYNSYMESEKKNKLVLTVFAREIAEYEPGENINPNDVYLDGYVCKEPVFRVTPFGREITDLLLAVNRSYNKSDYIPCITWGRNARFAGKLKVGDNIKVSGRMQSRDYQKRYENGEVAERTAYEISVSKLELVQ